MTIRFLSCAGLALALLGCAGPIRPAVSPALSSLPDEPEERAEQLASAAARPTPESGRRSSSEVERVETAAAGLAAFLGMLFSKTENAFVGFAVPIDETRLVAPKPQVNSRPRSDKAETPPGEPLLEIRAPAPRR
jgi:hypothetical protein